MATTGRNFSGAKLSWEKGQRRWNLERHMELREGFHWWHAEKCLETSSPGKKSCYVALADFCDVNPLG